jgi:hypothetical protein
MEEQEGLAFAGIVEGDLDRSDVIEAHGPHHGGHGLLSFSAMTSGLGSWSDLRLVGFVECNDQELRRI